ncbi:MAG: rod shape-determining protein [Endomicrobiales bacterium]|nr:rod shape-determining protein [Endomicrobiales bacterium]
MEDFVFSLDIGTRKIGAFITRYAEKRLEVVAYRIVEHETRAVRSGQIHDVEKVAEIVSGIKTDLERQTGLALNKVSTAIAGRNLRCIKASGELSFDATKEISTGDIRTVELSAIQNATTMSDSDIDDCLFVGYSVAGYRIDGEGISAPVGHYAGKISADVVATFLPKNVLESLFAVSRKTGLEITYITLEPMAAAEAILPAEIRSFSTVLIDIGAGTSDMALVSKNAIQDFGMIPFAGDCITESICSEFLVDFNEGERIKRELGGKVAVPPGCSEECISFKTVKFKDIFLREKECDVNHIIEKIAPSIREMCEKITCEIRKMTDARAFIRNFAIVLVGGGSLTPELDKMLAETLGIPVDRIGIRTPSMVDAFKLNRERFGLPEVSGGIDVFGPQTAVLFGTALLSHNSHSLVLMHVSVNGKRMELFNLSGSEQTVLSALITAGVPKKSIYGKVGLAKIFNLNGQLKTVKGGMPRAAKVTVNGEEKSLTAPLKEGDCIVFAPASDGKDASVKVKDLLVERPGMIFNGIEVSVPAVCSVNGEICGPETEITDNATVNIDFNASLKGLLAEHEIIPEKLIEKKIEVDVMGRKIEKNLNNYCLNHNGRTLNSFEEADYVILKPGDNVEFKVKDSGVKTGDFIQIPPQGRSLKVKINAEEFVFPGGMGKILLNGREVDENEQVNDGDIIRVWPGRDAEAVLVDIFRYISVDPKDTAGRRIKLFVNQEEANFTTPLTQDADVKVVFE